MTFVLDTNVVSELRRSPDPGVERWARDQPIETLHISVITVLELEVGVRRMERRDRRRGSALRSWLDGSVMPSFGHRILPVDGQVARRAAALHVPDPRPERDALIGATALAHGFIVVTRNVGDFEPFGVSTLDPWSH